MKKLLPNHIDLVSECVAHVACCTSCLVFRERDYAEEAMAAFPKASQHMQDATYEDARRYLAAVLRHALALLETGRPPEGKR